MLVVSLLVTGCFAAFPQKAEVAITVQMIDLTIGNEDSSFTVDGWSNVITLGDTNNYTDPSACHLAYSGNLDDVIVMSVFFDDVGISRTCGWAADAVDSKFSEHSNGDKGWVILTPPNWQLKAGIDFVKIDE
ncbi:MAG: hypothetical protein LBH62_09590 [Nitrososphaerota archaeon]|nr:hypothetical protein [Nitrososphaerota archaeon]